MFAIDVTRQPGTRRRSRLVSIGVLAILAIAPHAVARADDEDVITYRQLTMKQLDAQAAALGMIIAGQIPPDTLSLQANALANSARSALKAFEPQVPGGESKPEVWSNHDDFSRLMRTFVQKSEEMAKASESGNIAHMAELMIDALNCKQCHDTYRVKRKK